MNLLNPAVLRICYDWRSNYVVRSYSRCSAAIGKHAIIIFVFNITNHIIRIVCLQKILKTKQQQQQQERLQRILVWITNLTLQVNSLKKSYHLCTRKLSIIAQYFDKYLKIRFCITFFVVRTRIRNHGVWQVCEVNF